MSEQEVLQMCYIDVLRKTKNMGTSVMSICRGCGCELILRTVLQVAGKNSIIKIVPRCKTESCVVFWNCFNRNNKPKLDNTSSFLMCRNQIYERRKSSCVNSITFASNRTLEDYGIQNLVAAAERNEKMLYICYDNESYISFGHRRSSAGTQGLQISNIPFYTVACRKQKHWKYIPLIMSMHNVKYCATASPSDMTDFVMKIQKGLVASKKGFAYIHVFSPCPTGWGYKPKKAMTVARKVVRSNLFPLWEMNEKEYRMNYKNENPISIEKMIKEIGKFMTLRKEDIQDIQEMVNRRYHLLKLMCE